MARLRSHTLVVVTGFILLTGRFWRDLFRLDKGRQWRMLSDQCLHIGQLRLLHGNPSIGPRPTHHLVVARPLDCWRRESLLVQHTIDFIG